MTFEIQCSSPVLRPRPLAPYPDLLRPWAVIERPSDAREGTGQPKLSEVVLIKELPLTTAAA